MICKTGKVGDATYSIIGLSEEKVTLTLCKQNKVQFEEDCSLKVALRYIDDLERKGKESY